MGNQRVFHILLYVCTLFTLGIPYALWITAYFFSAKAGAEQLERGAEDHRSGRAGAGAGGPGGRGVAAWRWAEHLWDIHGRYRRYGRDGRYPLVI